MTGERWQRRICAWNLTMWENFHPGYLPNFIYLNGICVCFVFFCVPFLATTIIMLPCEQSLSIFLDKSGTGNKTLPATSTFFDLPLIQRIGWFSPVLPFFLNLRMINRHASSIYFWNLQQRGNFQLSKFPWVFPMSVTDACLPETYKFSSKKWNGNFKVWTILSFQGSEISKRLAESSFLFLTYLGRPKETLIEGIIIYSQIYYKEEKNGLIRNCLELELASCCGIIVHRQQWENIETRSKTIIDNLKLAPLVHFLYYRNNFLQKLKKSSHQIQLFFWILLKLAN